MRNIPTSFDERGREETQDSDEGVEGVALSDVRSVGSVVEKASVDGEDGGGVTGDDGGRREGRRVRSRTLKVGVRTSVSKHGRAGDDVDVRRGVSPTSRTVLASILHAPAGSETMVGLGDGRLMCRSQ